MEQKEFKITILDEGKVSKVAVLGQRIFLHKELSFFIHREHKGGEFRHPKLLWVITEEKTGRSIAIHTTKKLVIEKAREIVKEKDKPRKERALSPSKWQKKCDRLLQETGMRLYPHCEVCGKQANCLHHFFPKSVSARLRYDWDNLIPICQGCHGRHHQAGDPRIHGTVIEKRGGMKWYEMLLKKKNEGIQVNVSYYKGVWENLQLIN